MVWCDSTLFSLYLVFSGMLYLLVLVFIVYAGSGSLQLLPQAIRPDDLCVLAILQCPIEHGFLVAFQLKGEGVLPAFCYAEVLAEPVNNLVQDEGLDAQADGCAIA